MTSPPTRALTQLARWLCGWLRMPIPLAISRRPTARRTDLAGVFVDADQLRHLARRDQLGEAERDAEPAEAVRQLAGIGHA